MTPHQETAVQIACDLCVTQQKGTINVLKNTELLYIQNKVSYMSYELSIKKIYTLHSIYTFIPQKRIGLSNSYFIEWAGP